jgi:phosphatidylserine synthase
MLLMCNARAMNVESEIGMQLDSLAYAVSMA